MRYVLGECKRVSDVNSPLVPKGIKADVEQIGFGTMRKTELGHGLTRRRGKVELLTDTLKNIALGNAASVAFVDGGPQRGKLSLVSLFLTSRVRSAARTTSLAFS